MPANVELKAKIRDWERAHSISRELSGADAQILHQEDVFFNVSQGRLKLRILGGDRGELIHYDRPDVAGMKTSRYTIARTEDPANLLQILSEALKVTGTVTKVRSLYLVGQTRVHLDEVAGLGRFIELEVVLRDTQTEAEGQHIAQELSGVLGIEALDLLDMAYVDMLNHARRT